MPLPANWFPRFPLVPALVPVRFPLLVPTPSGDAVSGGSREVVPTTPPMGGVGIPGTAGTAPPGVGCPRRC